ncbi:outer membrane beta-barrel protein [Luteolibacter marinus]|uniref:outer membrane beta-barrel protein n=1 Tax=Luteolibacter marinus TaxID=2776705 RepID=UPI001866F605|nr:outer membrane beta-barrel protein [Luteolibacter marinus]
MKRTILSFVLLSGVALAGSSSKEVIPPPPAPEPALWNWFAGASAGYLVDYEEDMYHLHLGIDLPSRCEWQHSVFLECGWTSADDSFVTPPVTVGDSQFSLYLDSEVEIVPLTLNYKIERKFKEKLSAYVGAGIGVAFVDYEATAAALGGGGPTANFSDSDTVFAAQVFAGLAYQVTESFDLYGGARWIYLDDSDISVAPVGVGILEDDVLVEAGFRVNF